MRLAAVIAALALAAPYASHAAGPPPLGTVPPPVTGLAALPRIPAPRGPAQLRVNAALAQLDAMARKAWDTCRSRGGDKAEWGRSVFVPMRGPRFLLVVITDNVYCGGLHPNVSTQAVVYDLGTGQPVDWTALLPAGLVGTPTLEQGADAVRTVRIGTQRLSTLVLAGYKRLRPAADDAECRDAMERSSSTATPRFSAWLDGRSHALVLYRDLPHAVASCADPVALPIAVLRQEGVRGAVLDALAAP